MYSNIKQQRFRGLAQTFMCSGVLTPHRENILSHSFTLTLQEEKMAFQYSKSTTTQTRNGIHQYKRTHTHTLTDGWHKERIDEQAT